MNQLDFSERWEDRDEFARTIIRDSGGRVWTTLAISFVGSRPDLLVEAPHFVEENADRITTVLVDFFGALRPERLAVLWINRFALDDGTAIWAARVNSAEPAGGDRWTWRTRLHPYTVDPDTGAVDLFDSVDLDAPPDPGRSVCAPSTYAGPGAACSAEAGSSSPTSRDGTSRSTPRARRSTSTNGSAPRHDWRASAAT